MGRYCSMQQWYCLASVVHPFICVRLLATHNSKEHEAKSTQEHSTTPHTAHTARSTEEDTYTAHSRHDTLGHFRPLGSMACRVSPPEHALPCDWHAPHIERFVCTAAGSAGRATTATSARPTSTPTPMEWRLQVAMWGGCQVKPERWLRSLMS